MKNWIKYLIILIVIILLAIIISININNRGYQKDNNISPIVECEKSGGIWKEFPDTCVDSCGYYRGNPSIGCGEALTDGCDCGTDKCWNRDTIACENN